MQQAFPIGAGVELRALERDPYPIFAALRANEPISWVPALQMWYATRSADVQKILLDDVNFTTGFEKSTIFDTFGAHMLTVEGDLHGRYKAAARAPFMPKSIRATMEDKIRPLTAALIDGFINDGQTELRASFAARLPVQTILMLFGLPVTEEVHFREWYDSFGAALANFTWDEEIRATARGHVQSFHNLIQKYIDRFRAAPTGSLLSVLANDPSDTRMSDEEIRRNALIIFFGGISTVEAVILNTLYALFTHPEVFQRVRGDLSLLPQVLDESIRWLAPVQSATRHVVKDITFNGVAMKAGDTVNCMLGAANRDPAAFNDPDRFDIDRPNANRHIGFAVGPHHCLGSHLAKAEARIALEELITRLPDMALDPAYACVPEGYEFRQPMAMHLVW